MSIIERMRRRIRERLYRGPRTCAMKVNWQAGIACPECYRPMGPIREDCSLCIHGSPFWTGDQDESNRLFHEELNRAFGWDASMRHYTKDDLEVG